LEKNNDCTNASMLTLMAIQHLHDKTDAQVTRDMKYLKIAH